MPQVRESNKRFLPTSKQIYSNYTLGSCWNNKTSSGIHRKYSALDISQNLFITWPPQTFNLTVGPKCFWGFPRISNKQNQYPTETQKSNCFLSHSERLKFPLWKHWRKAYSKTSIEFIQALLQKKKIFLHSRGSESGNWLKPWNGFLD